MVPAISEHDYDECPKLLNPAVIQSYENGD
jgi:hypothetical protein